jgi:hypothetical protein
MSSTMPGTWELKSFHVEVFVQYGVFMVVVFFKIEVLEDSNVFNI